MIRTEEVVQVRAEVGDVAIGTDERENFPVRIGAFPEVPGVASNADASRGL